MPATVHPPVCPLCGSEYTARLDAAIPPLKVTTERVGRREFAMVAVTGVTFSVRLTCSSPTCSAVTTLPMTRPPASSVADMPRTAPPQGHPVRGYNPPAEPTVDEP